LWKEVIEPEDVMFIYNYLYAYRALPLSKSLMQSNYVFDADNNILVDFIGRFENLDEDVSKIKKIIGIDFTLPHLNKTIHKHYDQVLTKSAKELIRELWSVDFENLGYFID
jgi:hypothetical protein